VVDRPTVFRTLHLRHVLSHTVTVKDGCCVITNAL